MSSETIRIRMLLSGLVQGVGFRPFVCRLAQECGLSGFVGNRAEGVFVEVQGSASAIDAFQVGLLRHPPTPSRIDDVQLRSIECVTGGGFAIAASDDSPASGIVAPDSATCEDCLRELTDPSDRRFGYPFTTCSHCGPRFTIIRRLPYDRENTSLAEFAMCAKCAAEYSDPFDRRHHAQTIACLDCGPTLRFTDASGADAARGASAIESARRCLAGGGIVAVKGLGGFHLACDATNDAGVERLRARKERSDKPFALMVENPNIVRRYAELGPEEERLLTGRERPIVLLRGRESTLSQLVSPNTNWLGFMLPYAPVHHLLLTEGPLVMTSGNVSGEPIVSDNEFALVKLGGIADAFLLHDRDIVAPCDDSVFRLVDGAGYPIRRSRGHVPLPLPSLAAERSVLAVGGDLKGTACLANAGRAFLTPHLGDIENPFSLALLDDTIERYRNLFRIEPDLVACDLHPDYHTTRWAEEYARTRGLPLLRVQHHRAHVASLLTEHECPEPIIGVCFDGTGYGEDGAIWGGEFFTGDLSMLNREAHLAYTPLPGGDTTIQRPCRMALAWLHAAGLAWDESLPCVQASPPAERTLLAKQLERGLHCLPTSSVGRLFDGVASLTGVCQRATYEGQAAIELEAIVDLTDGTGYDFEIDSGSPMTIDARSLIRSIVRDLRNGVTPPVIAGRFHRGVAGMIVNVARIIRERTGDSTVGLTGGVFQNVTLLELLFESLRHERFEVLIHRVVPANDGGLSLGQAALAGVRRDA